ncbi:hypothetical protein ACFL6C_13450 [Myxococcota bacterium]
MAEKPQHPIIDTALACLRRNPTTASYVVDRVASKQLESALDQLGDSPDLADAVSTLAGLACYLDSECESPEAADAIMAIAARPLDALRSSLGDGAPLVVGLAAATEERGRAAERFLAKTASLAPENVPGEDSVPVGPLLELTLRRKE